MFPGQNVDIYVPLVRHPGNDEIGFFMNVFGRLRPGVTLAQAEADLARRHAAMVAQRNYLKLYAQELLPLGSRVTREARTPLLLVFGGVGAVLLMVCGNLANLLLVRAGSRSKDVRLRMALGASAARIVRESMTESGLMAVAGGAAGVVVALALTEWLRGASWLDLPRVAGVEVTGASIAFTVSVCAAVTLLFGLLPVLQVRRLDVAHALRPAASGTPNRRAARLQQATLLAQVAFTLMLAVAGALMLRSVSSLLQVDPGYRPHGVFAIRLDPAGRLRPPDRVPFFSRVLEQVAPLPGIQSAAMSYNVPMDGRSPGWDLAIPGQPFVPGQDVAAARMVSPGYFDTVGIPIRAGRDFTSRDTRESPWVVAVNETLARRIGENPIGRIIHLSGRAREVVAVVSDVRHNGLDAPAGWEFYVPYTQAPGLFGVYDLVVRTSSMMAVMPDIRKAVWSVDRAQAIAEPLPLGALIDRSVQRRRTMTWLLGGLGGAALLLAGLGIYGLVGYRLTQRRRELAIRIAVGAPRRRVVAVVLREVVVCVGLGIAAGLPLALGAGRALQSFLFNVAPQDAATFAATAAIVIAAALCAAYPPARRAGRMDPIAALRAE
jgi:putative ABC transport system permease protein